MNNRTLLHNLQTLVKQYHKELAHTKGIKQLRMKEDKLMCKNKDIGKIIKNIPWRTIWNHPSPSTSKEQFFLYRLKINALRTWDPRQSNNKSCIVRSCSTTQHYLRIEHILWKCPQAQMVWKHCLAYVTSCDNQRFLLPPITSMFGEEYYYHMSPLLYNIRNCTLAPRILIINPKAVLFLISLIWSTATRLIKMILWNVTVQRYFQDPQDQPDPDMVLIFKTQYTRRLTSLIAYYQHQKQWAYSKFLEKHLNILSLPMVPTYQENYIRLGFDGGSRGNPGPGGAGTYLISNIQQQWQLLWLSIDYLEQPSTTNNQAEYSALIQGLNEVIRRNVHTLTIIGDSKIIINQGKTGSASRKSTLYEYFAQAHALLQDIPVVHWKHQPRSFNTAADYLANYAMNTQKSLSIQSHSPQWQWWSLQLQDKINHDHPM